MNRLLYRSLDACYPTAKGDIDLACAFADFFMQKIDRIRIRSEIAVGGLLMNYEQSLKQCMFKLRNETTVFLITYE